MSNLLLLYDPIIVPILSEWIYRIDLAKLDCATCNIYLRSFLLRALTKCTVSNVSSRFAHSCLDWIDKRKIGFRELDLVDSSRYLSKSLQSIIRRASLSYSLTLTFNPSIWILFKRNQFRVHTLSIYGNGTLTDDDLAQILSQLPGIRDLTLEGEKSLTKRSIQIVADHCPDLKSIACRSLSIQFSLLSSHCPLSALDCYWESEELLLKSLLHLKSVRSLDLGFASNLSDKAVLAIAQSCPLLEYLDCSFHISDALVQVLAKSCCCLSTLLLVSCDISDLSLLAIAAHCHDLTKLDVSCCNSITDKGIIAISLGCHKLQDLTISRCCLSDLSVISLANHCRFLDSLHLDVRGLSTEPLLELMDKCPLLTSVEVNLDNWQPLFTKLVQACDHLTLLHMSQQSPSFTAEMEERTFRYANKIYADEELKLSGVHCSHLRSLTIQSRFQLDPETAELITKSFPLLESIDLGSNVYLLKNPLIILGRGTPNLRSFSIFASSFNDKDVLALVKNKNITKLVLGLFSSLDGDCLRAILTHCPNLIHLKIGANDHMDFGALVNGLKNLPKLTQLHLSGCRCVSDSLLHALLVSGKRMQVLDVRETSISGEAAIFFIQNMEEEQIEHFRYSAYKELCDCHAKRSL